MTPRYCNDVSKDNDSECKQIIKAFDRLYSLTEKQNIDNSEKLDKECCFISVSTDDVRC